MRCSRTRTTTPTLSLNSTRKGRTSITQNSKSSRSPFNPPLYGQLPPIRLLFLRPTITSRHLMPLPQLKFAAAELVRVVIIIIIIMSIAPEDFSQFDISEQEKDKLVGEVIRYILFKTEQNSGCPIKREELTQLITGKNYRQRNLPAFVINEAKTKLSSIFGYEMRELQRSRFSTSSHHSRASQSQQCKHFTK
ncbi:unnamed protein product [Fraxinus pennsylvanica]|uniref:MAGE domain-containing protein n=1 Tax=Fraxinus pennsylvanica TaxID=56036 RepID=A0AAD2EBM5_9LAMI|nr:unnamed protein product [Fraxinus pennsylvanica]